MLSDFLLPILQWEPTKRPSAQTLLDHPWLSMPDEYNHKMSDMEYQKYNLKQTTELQEQEAENQRDAKNGFVEKVNEVGIGELVDDDSEYAEADDEDNVSLDQIDTDDSVSLTGRKSHDSDEEAEFQTNVSFSGGYVPNTDLSRVDKGQGNPQFKGLEVCKA